MIKDWSDSVEVAVGNGKRVGRSWERRIVELVLAGKLGSRLKMGEFAGTANSFDTSTFDAQLRTKYGL